MVQAETLYRQGLHANGTPVVGHRDEGQSLQGRAAACVNCHRRSGFGLSEGKTLIPGISAGLLFRVRNNNAPAPDAMPASVMQFRAPYTESTVGRAIREGLGSDGQPLSLLMPRYDLTDQEIGALVDYLRQLSQGPFPGVSQDRLDFATIITPEAPAAAAEAMVATLHQFFQDREHIIAGEARPLTHTERGVVYRITRHWALHEWRLHGAPDTWAAQLAQYQQTTPAFAVISGIGGAHWAPVQDFCESAQLPCLFPNVDTPPPSSGFYSVYFSRGLGLESAVLQTALTQADPAASATPNGTDRRVLQVLLADGPAEQAAQQLAVGLGAQGWQVETRRVQPGSAWFAPLEQAPPAGQAVDLVLWLPPEELARLPARVPPLAGLWVSGLLGDLERAPMPAPWRARAKLTYPVELPERRLISMKLPEGWFRIHHLALDAPRIQFQTYTACQILSEMVSELQGSFVPEYLLERSEVMLSHRRQNGLFGHLSLGIDQRYASKGAYLVTLDDDGRVHADGDWRVP